MRHFLTGLILGSTFVSAVYEDSVLKWLLAALIGFTAAVAFDLVHSWASR